MKTIYSSILAICLCSILNAQEHMQINYLNSISPPADSIVIFAKGIVSLKNTSEEKICFSPDGKEVFFGRHPNGSMKNYFSPRVMHAAFTNGKWSIPDTISFSKKRIVGYPLLSPNGSILYMEEPTQQTNKRAIGRIVFSKKVAGKWIEPSSIFPKVKAKEGFGLAQITTDSTFYFHDRFDRIAYAAKLKNGKYEKPEPLSYRINPCVEFFVSPENDYIIFIPIEWSNQFHISFKNDNNEWAMPIPFSKYFKKEKGWNGTDGYGPYVSPDKKYFFFSKKGDIYWVKADFIEVLRKKSKQ